MGKIDLGAISLSPGDLLGVFFTSTSVQIFEFGIKCTNFCLLLRNTMLIDYSKII